MITYRAIGKNKNGFTIVEAVVVLAVLSTLSAISIPRVLDLIKLGKIDETKALMNAAMVECLEEFRQGKDISITAPTSISNERLSPLGYSVDSTNNNCAYLTLCPKETTDPLFYKLDFRISNYTGKAVKLAESPSSDRSLNSCKSWAGNYCGASNSQIALIENEFLIEKQKNECENTFFDWRNTAPSGSKERWDDSLQTCSKLTWVHKKYIAKDEDEYLSIKSSEECNTAKENYSSYTGEMFISECNKTFYFFKGVDLGSLNLLQAQLIEEEEAACKVKKETNRLTASNGKILGEASAGSCGDSYWICEEKILSSLDQFKESTCYTE